MFRFRRYRMPREIAPEDIFLDSSNLPMLETSQFEGRVVAPVGRGALLAVGVVFLLAVGVFGVRAYTLQVAQGAEYAKISRDNTLDRSILFATRGIIKDRTGRELAWNSIPEMIDATSSPQSEYTLRRYTQLPGMAHVLGYIRYPQADTRGYWWREDYSAVSGAEFSFDNMLGGINGDQMVESDARGTVVRRNIVHPPVSGADVRLSIDADVQSTLYTMLRDHARENGFQGGAAVIMDVRTGELLALTSFPEYDNAAFTNGVSEAVAQAAEDERSPMLNRAIAGLYTPGSIVKPIFAAAALNEKLIAPEKTILSTGKIEIPNPYDPEKPSIYRDWTVHGAVDMRTAIAVSSDEYFYTIGGGYGGQKGLGIARIDDYARRFGLGSTTGIALRGESEGVIPTPEWKAVVFPGDPWRLGNTYHTVIGQYGFQITPLQAARFTAAIANGGKLPIPKLLASSTPEYIEVGIPDEYLRIVREGMRLAVTSPRTDATVKSLYLGGIKIAAKSGTAQTGARNQWMNSWSVGFWPVEEPRFAFAVVLEKAPAGTLRGASPALTAFFLWLIEHHPEYVN